MKKKLLWYGCDLLLFINIILLVSLGFYHSFNISQPLRELLIIFLIGINIVILVSIVLKRMRKGIN